METTAGHFRLFRARSQGLIDSAQVNRKPIFRCYIHRVRLIGHFRPNSVIRKFESKACLARFRRAGVTKERTVKRLMICRGHRWQSAKSGTSQGCAIVHILPAPAGHRTGSIVTQWQRREVLLTVTSRGRARLPARHHQQMPPAAVHKSVIYPLVARLRETQFLKLQNFPKTACGHVSIKGQTVYDSYLLT